MAKTVDKIVEDMDAGREIHFGDLAKVCEHFFGKPRQSGTSHHVYKMPWPGNPRVNIQNEKGKGKPYQIRQVLAAIAKLREMQAAAAAAAAAAKSVKGKKPEGEAQTTKKKK